MERERERGKENENKFSLGILFNYACHVTVLRCHLMNYKTSSMCVYGGARDSCDIYESISISQKGCYNFDIIFGKGR